ncbi:hypothetical protein Q0P32_14630, partial [Staphylococcus aureus]|nr:hypothetical protein [Staphylococcus aureus]
TLNVPYDEVRIPALRALRHLVDSNSRRRPRQNIVDLLQPYQLKTRVRDLAESDTSVSVRAGAVALLELLERAK